MNILLRHDLNSHFHQTSGSGNSLFVGSNILDIINEFQNKNQEDRTFGTSLLKLHKYSRFGCAIWDQNKEKKFSNVRKKYFPQ